MINIVAGFGENKNILLAANEANKISDLHVSIANSEEELINAFSDKTVDAVIRGSLNSSKIMNELKNLNKTSNLNRATYINSFEDKNIKKNYEFLLLPVGIDEGKTIEEKMNLVIQSAEFIKCLNKEPKIAILAGGRKDDFGRSELINDSLKNSEKLEDLLKSKFKDILSFEENSYSIKNYYILIEKAINEGNNIIIAPDGISGNIIFRTLVLLNSWPSYGAITLGINEIFIDTSRDQSMEGYLRSLKLAYKLAKFK